MLSNKDALDGTQHDCIHHLPSCEAVLILGKSCPRFQHRALYEVTYPTDNSYRTVIIQAIDADGRCYNFDCMSAFPLVMSVGNDTWV